MKDHIEDGGVNSHRGDEGTVFMILVKTHPWCCLAGFREQVLPLSHMKRDVAKSRRNNLFHITPSQEPTVLENAKAARGKVKELLVI